MGEKVKSKEGCLPEGDVTIPKKPILPSDI